MINVIKDIDSADRITACLRFFQNPDKRIFTNFHNVIITFLEGG